MIKEEIKKLFGDDGYISLSALSKISGYSLEYLLTIASTGKLKAFKMGDGWLTTKEWFAQYQVAVKNKINREVADQKDNSGWVQDVYDAGYGRLKILLPHAAISVLFICFVFWLVFYPAGNRFSFLLGGAVDDKQIIGALVASDAGRTYGALSQSVVTLLNNSIFTARLAGDLIALVGDKSTDLAYAYNGLILATAGSYAVAAGELVTSTTGAISAAVNFSADAIAFVGDKYIAGVYVVAGSVDYAISKVSGALMQSAVALVNNSVIATRLSGDLIVLVGGKLTNLTYVYNELILVTAGSYAVAAGELVTSTTGAISAAVNFSSDAIAFVGDKYIAGVYFVAGSVDSFSGKMAIAANAVFSQIDLATSASNLIAEIDKKTMSQRFYDEGITDYFYGLLAVLKNSYKQVAGAVSVRTQLYRSR